MQLVKKDFGLAVEAGRRVKARMMLADAGLQAYTGASKDPKCRDSDCERQSLQCSASTRSPP